jgi:hypothetical protein
MKMMLELWDRGEDIEPLLTQHPSADLVTPISWYCILAGLQRLPPAARRVSAKQDAPPRRAVAQRIRSLTDRCRSYPDHFSYLARLRGTAQRPGLH